MMKNYTIVLKKRNIENEWEFLLSAKTFTTL